MAVNILEFFGLAGIDATAPATFPELITWLVSVAVGLVLLSLALKIVSCVLRALIEFRR